jgi:hypothetical protein
VPGPFDPAVGTVKDLTNFPGDWVGRPLASVVADRVGLPVVLSNDARAVALMNLGIVELWSFRLDDAERHLEQGLALAADRPALRPGRLSLASRVRRPDVRSRGNGAWRRSRSRSNTAGRSTRSPAPR